MTTHDRKTHLPLSVRSGELEGQVALVTGGGRGIGRAIAQALAAAGATIVITSRSQEELNQTLALLEQEGGHGRAITADVTNQSSIEHVVQQAEEQSGSIDLLVNNAGSSVGLGKIAEVDPKLWWRDVETNVYGSFLCTHAVLPGMLARQRGRIITVASLLGTVPFPYGSAYSVSKTALIRFTETLALETQGQGISTFAIHPGTVLTQLTPQKSPESGSTLLPDQFVEGFRALSVDPPELGANLIAFLATGKADALSGRYISAHDDTLTLIERAEEIQRNNLYTLRLSV